VKRDPLKPTHAEGCQPILMLQSAELALDCRPTGIKLAPSLCLARHERVPPVGLDPDRLRSAGSEGAAPLGSAALEVGTRECPAAVLAGRYVIVSASLLLADLRDDRPTASGLATVVDRA